VDFLRKLDRVDLVKRLMRRNKDLEDEVLMLRKALFLHTGRPYPPASGAAPVALPFAITTNPESGAGFDVDGLPPGGHAGDNYGPHTFGSPYLGATNPYDQWPSSVVPVPSTVTANSVESSPGASGPGEDFTPAYVHTSMPAMEGPIMASRTSAPSSLDSSRGEYQELDAGMRGPAPHATQSSPGWPLGLTGRRVAGSSTTNGFPSSSTQPSSSTYLQESPWSIYPTGGTYYSQAAAL